MGDFRHKFLASERSRCASDINTWAIDPELLQAYGYSMDPGYKHEIDTTMLLRHGLSRGVFTPHGKDDDETIHSRQENLSENLESGDEEMDDSYLKMNFRPLKFSRTREYQRSENRNQNENDVNFQTGILLYFRYVRNVRIVNQSCGFLCRVEYLDILEFFVCL